MLKKVILITGANGEIGQSLINELNKVNINNIITIDLKPLNKKHKVEKHFNGSILDTTLLKSINQQYIVYRIFHLAAILSTKAEQNITLSNDVNINGTQNILDLALTHSKRNSITIPFFFPSSIAVYNCSKNKEQEVLESMTNELPMTAYGRAKLQCENMGVEYMNHCNNQELDFRCIRFPGIISASSMPSGGTSDYVPEMIHHAASNLKYHCFVNKNTQIPFIVMPDAIQAIFDLMNINKNRLKNHIYNVTAFTKSANDFYKKIKLYYPDFEMSYTIDSQRQAIVNSWPNYINDDKARRDWNWNPQYDFDNAYSKYIIPEIKHYKREKNNEQFKK